MNEKDLQAAIVKLLRAHRVHVSVLGTVRRRNADGSAPHYGTQQTPGLPDLWLMWKCDHEWCDWPHGVWVEVKTKTGGISPAQRAWHEQAVGARFVVEVWRSVDDALRWLYLNDLRRRPDARLEPMEAPR